METRYLRDFLALTRYLNFGSAAEANFVSASVLSKHIASLEKELNIKLFNRTTRSVDLTEYGKLFIQYATKITEAEDSFRKHLATLSDKTHNTLRILATPVILHYGVVKKISCFRKEHPEIDLQIIECQPLYFEETFKKGIYDISICGRPSSSSSIKQCLIVKSNLVAVLKSSHPLAGLKILRIDQLQGEHILLHSETTNLYEPCMNRFSEVGITPIVFYKGVQPDIILQFVSQGMGIALMVKRIVEYYGMENIRYVDIDPIMDVFLYLGWDEKKSLKPAAKLLIQYLAP